MLSKSHLRKFQAGRKQYQQRRTELIKEKTKKLLEDGIKDVGELSKRELFLAGIVLYWAEGFKHPEESGLGLATSDPAMATFYIYWLKTCLGISSNILKLRVTANYSHAYRISEIQNYWSNYLNVPQERFTKPFFQRTVQKKYYANYQNYHGVIRIHVPKSLDRLRKMRGWLEGIKNI